MTNQLSSIIQSIKKELGNGISKNRIILISSIQNLTQSDFPECLQELKHVDSYITREERVRCECSKKNIKKVNLFLLNNQEITIGSCCIKFIVKHTDLLLDRILQDDNYNSYNKMEDEKAFELLLKYRNVNNRMHNIQDTIKECLKCKICKESRDKKNNLYCCKCRDEYGIFRNSSPQYYNKCIICKRIMKFNKTLKGEYKFKCYDCYKK